MKETVKTSRTAGYLEKIFRALNVKYFNGELEEPIITIQSTPRAYGHVTVAKAWQRGDTTRHELNIGAGTLARPIENVVATTLHECVHLWDIQNGIQDCSRGGAYHNKKFKEAAEARAAIAEVEQAALTAGWDGAWFRRAYDAFGQPIGSKECDEGQIFIEPQGMCVMAGIGKETGQAAQALKSVEERLDTKYGVVLHQPAYTSYQLNLGEISSYPPGYKENAGIFCHNNPWISCAEAVLGHGDRAFEVYRKTCPAYIEDISEIHRTEPYVYSQMVAGKDAPTFGEAKNSWLTGTAAWTFFNVSQYILGIQPTLDGLKVDPCIPHTLGGFTVTRRYRGATYHIAVDNTAAVQYGVKSVAVDGKPIEGSLLPLAPEGAVVEVQVTMG